MPDSVGRGPAEGATIEFAVDVWIEQHPSEPGLWDDLGEHQLFQHVVRMSDGTLADVGQRHRREARPGPRPARSAAS